MVKGGFIADARILDLVEEHAASLSAPELDDDALSVLEELRRLFGFEAEPAGRRTRLIVISHRGREVALQVDSAREFAQVPEDGTYLSHLLAPMVICATIGCSPGV